ncbi:MAG: putative ski2-type helicase [Candidatus Methanofastidiosum methylothiophilum]|uniref:Putative ski2-type helicase n=1 Tax=Candidatus Methanofastidiosum methylothiophilum TaxID=1705564 RepID=A0A150INF7_9EURY|nr:MAG: putative ski2-type helicase [Candidatus Methanofastidiosum methylthiophilus]KYC48410.1 MAG: putative ski2-type helicase [Candidatus Methanofastidiosum methylthiophilus]KYC51078.1 MAG: putative ski2-type helicase [Candidatus Methanofastidiosum methylthiophilus]
MIENILIKLRNDPSFDRNIAHVELIPERKSLYGEVKEELPDSISDYLERHNIRLYKHQCDSLEEIRNGNNIVITTPTASGKTLAFNIPIFEALEKDRHATALYLYPAKALSNDQLKVLKALELDTEIRVNPNVYDGDTPSAIRPKIRNESRIIVSNPYEMHHILPWNYKWQHFFSNLKFIVLDEAHIYRGVFGSNVSLLIRRLERVCEYYGSKPQFIISTATLANPIEFAEKLTGLKYRLISEDGSPKGKKYFIFYNPYKNGDYLSTHQESKRLFLFFIREGLQTLCFTVSRKMSELIARWSKESLEPSEESLKEKIMAYRAGYLPEERRKIENGLKNGVIKGVTSTNALELGIDIGGLDSVIISGYPGTVISTWQQAGRAGRGANDSVATLVAFQNQLDQYFMRHPQVFFGKPHEHAIVDLKNPYILFGHTMCASSELPIVLERDKKYLGEHLPDILNELKNESLVKETPNGWIYSGTKSASMVVSLDSISSDIFKVMYQGRTLETMDRRQAYREAHEGVVLLHQGETYIVDEMDLNKGIIKVNKTDVDFYTQVLKESFVSIIDVIQKKSIGNIELFLGHLRVTENYNAYKIMRGDSAIGYKNIYLPPLEFNTVGFWFTFPNSIEDELWEKRSRDRDILEMLIKRKNVDIRREVFSGALHGIEHGMIGIMPFHVMCDRWDIGGLSTNFHPSTGKSTVFIYDGFDGGIGLSEKAYELFGEITKTTLELVKECSCKEGCPACIYSPKCGNDNKPMDKSGTIFLLMNISKLFYPPS